MHAEKPSRTALKVALNVLSLSCDRQMDDILPPGIAESTAELLIQSGAASATVVRWARSGAFDPIYRAASLLMPQQYQSFAWRKAFCDHQVRQAIENDSYRAFRDDFYGRREGM